MTAAVLFAEQQRADKDGRKSTTTASTVDALLQGRKSVVQLWERRIAFQEMRQPDRQYEQLRKKYKPINNNNGTLSSGVAYSKGKSTLSSLAAEGKQEDPEEETSRLSLFPASEIRLQWERVYKIGKGLLNAGNTCFLNSVLQCLLYTPPLANYLLSKHHAQTCRMQPGGFCALCELQRLAVQCMQSGGQPVLPRAFIYGLKHIAKTLKPGRQEDAHEFFIYLMESLQKSCLHGLPRDLDAATKNTTAIQRVFGGHLESTVECSQCKYPSRTRDPILDLCLEIKGCDSVDKALRQFTRSETLFGSNRYQCEKCKKPVDARKFMSIAECPPVLVVQLKRFHYGFMGGGKINKHIAFEESLDLGPYVSKEEKQKQKRMQYKLHAVLVHAGSSTRSGHYYSFVKSSSGVWYEMDDETVSQVKLLTVLKQNAYMLFYTRDDPLRVKQESVSNGNIANFVKTPTPAQPDTMEATKPNGIATDPDVSRPIATAPHRPQLIREKPVVNGPPKAKLPPPPIIENSETQPPTLAPTLAAPPKRLSLATINTKPSASKPSTSKLTNSSISAAPLVNWDDHLEDKRAKLDKVMERERALHTADTSAPVTSADAALESILFKKDVGQWNDASASAMIQQNVVAGPPGTTKKFKRPAMMDLDYDRGKQKKRKHRSLDLFQMQKEQGNPFTATQLQFAKHGGRPLPSSMPYKKMKKFPGNSVGR